MHVTAGARRTKAKRGRSRLNASVIDDASLDTLSNNLNSLSQLEPVPEVPHETKTRKARVPLASWNPVHTPTFIAEKARQSDSTSPKRHSFAVSSQSRQRPVPQPLRPITMLPPRRRSSIHARLSATFSPPRRLRLPPAALKKTLDSVSEMPLSPLVLDAVSMEPSKILDVPYEAGTEFVLLRPAHCGDMVIHTNSREGLAVEDQLIINQGGPNEEKVEVAAFRSIVLRKPLLHDHMAGEHISKISGAHSLVVGPAPKEPSAAPHVELSSPRQRVKHKIMKKVTAKETDSIKMYLLVPPDRDEKMQYLRYTVAEFTEGDCFQMLTMFVIVVNSIMIGYTAEAEPGAWAGYMEFGFSLFYLAELGLRAFGLGVLFVRDYWNICDAFIVLYSGTESFLWVVGEGDDDTAGSTVNVWRLLRLIRFVRLRRLQEVLYSSLTAMVNCAWAAIIFLILLYALSVVTVNYAKNTTLFTDLPEAEAWFLTIPRALVSFLQIITWDSWYSQMGRPIMDQGRGFLGALIIFSAMFGGLGLLNLIAAIYVDTLLTAKNKTTEMHENSEQREKMVTRILTKVFEVLDTSQTGVVDEQEFRQLLRLERDEQWLEYLQLLDTSPEDLDEALLRFWHSTEAVVIHADKKCLYYHDFLHAYKNMDHSATRKEVFESECQLTDLSRHIHGLKEQLRWRSHSLKHLAKVYKYPLQSNLS